MKEILKKIREIMFIDEKGVHFRYTIDEVVSMLEKEYVVSKKDVTDHLGKPKEMQ